MEHWTALIQTGLWVSLITGIAYRFHEPLQALLEALVERIKSGSDVTAGPFSVWSIQSLAVSEQVARADQEIEEANNASYAAVSQAPFNESPTPTPSNAITAPTPQFRARYFQAEDLALRAVQSEFGQPISRQITGGRDQGFDGAFVQNNCINIVEVRYVAKAPPKVLIQQSLRRIQSYIASNNWRRVNLIMVIVVDHDDEVEPTQERITAVAAESPVPVTARVYALSDLKLKFGIIDETY